MIDVIQSRQLTNSRQHHRHTLGLSHKLTVFSHYYRQQYISYFGIDLTHHRDTFITNRK